MKASRALTLIALCAALVAPMATATQDAAGPVTVLTNANIIDATGSPVQDGMTVVITGNTITSITHGAYQRTGEEDSVIDLDGAYVVPGFWNMHTHLTALLPHNHALDGASSGSKVIRAGVRAGRPSSRRGGCRLPRARYGLTDHTIELMARRGTFLRPDDHLQSERR